MKIMYTGDFTPYKTCSPEDIKPPEITKYVVRDDYDGSADTMLVELTQDQVKFLKFLEKRNFLEGGVLFEEVTAVDLDTI